MKRSDAISLVERKFSGDEFAIEIITFIRSLKRGLTKWFESGCIGRDDEE
jgi:hypothetical protein